MKHNRNRGSEQSERMSNQGQQQEQNQSLQQGSTSSVADYGRSEQQQPERSGLQSERSENSDRLQESEETIGNP